MKFDLTISLFLGIPILAYIALWLLAFKNEELKFWDSKKLWECEVCLSVYISFSDQEVTRCPLCGSYNKRVIK